MERFTKRVFGYAHGRPFIPNEKVGDWDGSYSRGEFDATLCVDKLADYEDAEEQGLLLKLPCNVGDIVYDINFYSDDTIFVSKVEDITWRNSILALDEYDTPNGFTIYTSSTTDYHSDQIGISIFFKKEEAESALSQRSSNQYQINKGE